MIKKYRVKARIINHTDDIIYAKNEKEVKEIIINKNSGYCSEIEIKELED